MAGDTKHRFVRTYAHRCPVCAHNHPCSVMYVTFRESVTIVTNQPKCDYSHIFLCAQLPCLCARG